MDFSARNLQLDRSVNVSSAQRADAASVKVRKLSSVSFFRRSGRMKFLAINCECKVSPDSKFRPRPIDAGLGDYVCAARKRFSRLFLGPPVASQVMP